MRNRWPILALLCVLASLLAGGIASAHAASGAENRVWGFDLAEQIHVGGQRALTPELHQGYELAEYDSASGSLLAAKGAPKPGDKVYRVWGDKAGPNGSYWSRTNPADVPNYRDAAGLPDRNSGRFVTEGRLTDTTGVTSTPGGAASLGGNRGGLDEVVIPNPGQQVEVTGVSGVNPEL